MNRNGQIDFESADRVVSNDTRYVTYNGENRPVRWVRESDNMAIAMSYDHMGRRRAKNSQRFFYDGYLQICSYHTPTPTPNSNCYIWDPTEPVATRPLVWNCDSISAASQHALYYAHDGNKNVSEVVDSDVGIAAHYEYAPFGVVIAQQGELSETNPWRFSSEYGEVHTGTIYYNYRHYCLVFGRWLCRDPIGENRGVNLFAFCYNNVCGAVDGLGLKCKIIIYGGHATSAQRYMENLSRNGKGPAECGDLIGFVTCFRDSINADADKRFPGHVIPDIPRDPGPLHNDNNPNPQSHELASKGLERAWIAAQDAVASVCQECCCKSVVIKVVCDASMKRMTTKLYIKGMNNPTYPQFDWCGRTMTVECPQGEK